MSAQRRYKRFSQPFIAYPTKESTDARGNVTRAPDLTKPIHMRGAFVPVRSSKAEVPGAQIEVALYTLILDPDVEEVDSWSRIKWRDQEWDIASPPLYRHGPSRHVRHWSIDLRKRPSG